MFYLCKNLPPSHLFHRTCLWRFLFLGTRKFFLQQEGKWPQKSNRTLYDIMREKWLHYRNVRSCPFTEYFKFSLLWFVVFVPCVMLNFTSTKQSKNYNLLQSYAIMEKNECFKYTNFRFSKSNSFFCQN